MRIALALLLILSAAFAQADRLSLDDLKTLIDVGIDDAEIVSRIRRVKRLEITADGIEELRKAGASEAVLAALRARLKPQSTPLVDRVIDQLKKGVEEEQILLQILSQPQRVQLSIDDVLRLRKADATKRVIRALRGDFVFHGYTVYKHPFSIFQIQHLKGWTVQEIRRHGDLPAIVISPDGNHAKADEVTTGVVIGCTPLNAWAKWALDLGIVPVMKSLIAADLRELGEQNPRLLRDKSKIAPTTLAGYPAAFNQIDVTRRGVDCRRMFVRSFLQGDVDVSVELVAPVGRFERFLPVFRRMLASLRVFTNDQTPVRRSTPVDRGAILDRYRESVVMIKAYFDGGHGYGTGFFVREDGYVLTNHHVVHHNGKAAKRIEVVWDSEVPKDEGRANRVLSARLIDAERGDGPLFDIAVLKVPKSKWAYKPLPLSPVGSGTVRVEDEVIALGFPYPDSFGKVGRLITTNGHISRINRLADVGSAAGIPDDIVLDITINKGNSGGPCIDLRTGAVVGLNTQVVIAPGLTGGVEKLEYGRVCLIDHALRRFPQLRWYPHGRAMEPAHHIDLAEALLDWGNYPAARRELDAVVTTRLDGQNRARYYYQRARYESFAGDPKKFTPNVKKALEAFPKYPNVLNELALDHMWNRRYEKALEFVERMRLEQPRDWSPGYTRAQILRSAGRLEDALATIDRELRLGASYHPQPWIAKSQILLGMGRRDKAEQTLRDGLSQAPHYETRLALANYMVATKKQLDEAQRLYAEAVKLHPSEPRVHEAYGRFLYQQKRGADAAISHTLEAITLDRQRGGRPTRAALDVVYQIGKPANSKYGKHALQAALLIAERWPEVGTSQLGEYWRLRKRWSLASAHSSGGTILRLTDLDAMAAAGYPPRVFERTVYANALDLSLRQLGTHLKKKETRWTNWHVLAVLVQHERDQLIHSRRLARLIEVKRVGKIQSDGKRYYITLSLKNTGSIPLTDIWLDVSYSDKNKKSMFAQAKIVPSAFMPLYPGETRTHRFNFHPFQFLKSKGVDTSKIDTVKWPPGFARNASFLANVKIVEAKVTKEGYKFRIDNRTPYKLVDPTIRCDFVDRKGKPVQYAGRPPIIDGAWFKLEIPKKSKTGVLNVPSWGDFKYLTETLGLPTMLKNFSARLAIASARPVR